MTRASLVLGPEEDPWPYRGPLDWLRERTILLSRHGSHAYGLNTETSDVDWKGVCVPPARLLHGFVHEDPKHPYKPFEQAEQKKPHDDLIVYDVRKFLHLASTCNPNILEILFTQMPDVLVMTEAGKLLRRARQMFVTKKAKDSFAGYAKDQIGLIERHYRWLKNPPKAPPTRKEAGLPERMPIPADQIAAAQSAVEKKLARWNLSDLNDVDPATVIMLQGTMAELLAEIGVGADERYMAAARTLGFSDNFIHLLDLERQYNNKQKDWASYQGWLRTRNPARAADEEKFGFSGKYAMHAVRLGRMGIEILRYGEVRVYRAGDITGVGGDREELLAIRNGAWSYERLIEWARRSAEELLEAYNASTLPVACDLDAVNRLCLEIVESML